MRRLFCIILGGFGFVGFMEQKSVADYFLVDVFFYGEIIEQIAVYE